VVEAGPAHGRLVLLLHGFPEFWWTWREQLPALAAAGYRAVAMDLRGYGGSDKTPNGYDPLTLASDVSGVVKALGARSAVLVGHGWGGYVGWATAVLHAREVDALCAVSAPHPTAMLRSLRPGRGVGALRHVLAMQVPMLPERRLADPSSGFLRDHLTSWSAPGSAFPDEEAVATYQRAIALWPSSHCALEYHRWLFRSRLRADGRAFRAAMDPLVEQPVCCIEGAEDRALPAAGVALSRRHVAGELTEHRMPGVAHFPHEEDPAAFTGLLLPWLATLPPPG
jgi:pimeloyl-ACP methyl ester carboxylesterase